MLTFREGSEGGDQKEAIQALGTESHEGAMILVLRVLWWLFSPAVSLRRWSPTRLETLAHSRCLASILPSNNQIGRIHIFRRVITI
jgi:hypothetical protein